MTRDLLPEGRLLLCIAVLNSFDPGRAFMRDKDGIISFLIILNIVFKVVLF